MQKVNAGKEEYWNNEYKNVKYKLFNQFYLINFSSSIAYFVSHKFATKTNQTKTNQQQK